MCTIFAVANVSYLRAGESERPITAGRGSRTAWPGGHGRGRYVLAGVMLAAVAAAVAAGVLLTSAKASLSSDSIAIAKIGMPLGGGTVESVSAVMGPQRQPVPVTVRDGRIYPRHLIAANQRLSVHVVVKRPGWISWLAGSKEQLSLTTMTPVASTRSHYVTVSHGGPLRLGFKEPVSAYSYGASPVHLKRVVLPHPVTSIVVPHRGDAGTVFVSAQPRNWEKSASALFSWFPAGSAASVVANPAPGARIDPATNITLTFSKPVSTVLGSHLPPVSPTTSGSWHRVSSHAIEFRPQGVGYGLGAKVQIPLPKGVRMLGGTQSGSTDSGTWTVPAGSTTRLQQMLALLGYLPVNFKYSGKGVSPNPAAEEAAAVNPPKGHFTWRWHQIPSELRNLWQPGASGEMTKGALMAFENDHGMTPDGVASPAVWNALIKEVLAGHRSTFGYTFVSVSEGSPETESTWHNGRVRVSGLVNTGVAGAATAQGVFAVFEHALSVTMSGTNPGGGTYSDPGVPYVSYFNGGDALHGFIRGGYGYPQSLGCVEMPYSEAGAVYPYTPIGTVVDVT